MAPTKPTLSWPATIGTVAASFAIIAALKGISGILPPLDQAVAPEDVTIGANNPHYTITLNGPDGKPLSCTPDSTGFIPGWRCGEARINTQTVDPVDDPGLAALRTIRAVNYSAMPDSATVTNHNNATTVELNREQATTIIPDLPDNTTLSGIAIPTEDNTILVSLQGDPTFVNSILDQMIAKANQ